MKTVLTKDTVIERSRSLPAFPTIINKILTTLDDVEANLNLLAAEIQHDPVIAARVLSRANSAATRTRRLSTVRDIYAATSLIGVDMVREMVMICSLGNLVYGAVPAEMSSTFWQHSVAVGVCSVELALHTAARVSAPAALIAGLLHDIGQLWLYRFDVEAYHIAWKRALSDAIGIEEAEREQFGVDHSTIGVWLAEHWTLPAAIVASINYHHAPDAALDEPLVPLVHVAEVLSNALDLTGRNENRVTSLSSSACEKLGLIWDKNIHPLFGRMEARSRHANALFK